MKSQHKIKTLKVEVEADNKQKALDLQNRFSRLCRNEFRQYLDNIFNQLSPSNVIHRIEQLNIDLGEFKDTISDHQLQIAFEEKVLTHVQQAVWSSSFERQPNSLVRTGSRHSRKKDTDISEDFDLERDDNEKYFYSHEESLLSNMHFMHVENLQEESLNSVHGEDDISSEPHEVPKEYHSNEWIEYYLTTGCLPWWYKRPEHCNIYQQVVEFLKVRPKLLGDLLNRDLNYLKRLIYTSSKESFAVLSEVICLRMQGRSDLYVLLCKLIFSIDSEHWTITKARLYEVSAEIFKNISTSADEESLIKSIFKRSLQQGDKIFVNNILKKVTDKYKENNLSESERDFYGLIKTISLERQEAFYYHLEESQFPPCIPGRDECSFSETNSIELKNCGIFLLSKWIPEQLELLGVTKLGRFPSEFAIYKAMRLINSLVNDSDEVGEFDLVLEKVLCGLSVEQPIITDINIKTEEKVEFKSIIKKFLNDNDGFNDMPVKDFIDIFLCRNGLLSIRDNRWLLTVQSEGRDILLNDDFYPTFTAQFPWMKDAITIEWDANAEFP